MREDCDIQHKEQGYLHREKVQWDVGGVALLGMIVGVWFGGRRVVGAARQGIRRIVREELDGPGRRPGS